MGRSSIKNLSLHAERNIMSYLVLARKYRPHNFEQVIGQSHITELFKKAILSNRIAHAYLFCGPRGVGKTSCARILAKSLNCQKGPTLMPCDECPACKEIAKGNSFDVLEIDGASNRGIDEIRTLRENVKFSPSYGKYKIYIVDEVHMLTLEAFNALLKTLEEPPAHVKFIFATTDPNKVPVTIISRCQRCDFKRIPFTTIIDALNEICQKEKYQVEKDALYAIAKGAEGSFRDALSILDQISALSETKIKSEDICSMLGIVETEILFQLSDAISQKDCSNILKVFHETIEKGKDVKQFNRDLIEHFRNLMVIKIGGKSLGRLVDYPVAIKEMYLNQSSQFLLPDILQAIDMFIEAQEIARITESFRIPLELAFAKMTFNSEDINQRTLATSSSSKNAAYKFSPTDLLKNKKGQVHIGSNLSPNSSEESTDNVIDQQNVSFVEQDLSMPTLDLEKIKKAWDALTYAVSRKKMSLATYLQEGLPVNLKDKTVCIGFSKEHSFYKESLDSNENRKIIEQIFSDKLKTNIKIEYMIVDDAEKELKKEEAAFVKTTLSTFKGKVVSKWHKE